MEFGYVKMFDAKKGYGFIELEGRPDVFVHWTDIVMDGFKKLAAGDAVIFRLVEEEDGRLKAVDVLKRVG